MTKDEIISMLQAEIVALRVARASLTMALQTALDNLPPTRSAGPLSGTARSQLFRQRKKLAMQRGCNENATENVAESSTDATKTQRNATEMQRKSLHTPHIARDLPVSLQVDVPGTSLKLENRSHDLLGGACNENATKCNVFVAPRAFDKARAESDAAKRGIVDAAFEAELQGFTDYWDSTGWKRKNGPIKDRNAAWRSWLASPYQSGKNGRKPDPQASVQEWLDMHREPENVIEGQTV